MAAQEIKVPDIGDFTDVPIIEILVNPGDTVAVDDPLLTLESDKATLDVPSPVAGTVTELKVSVGDSVSEGTVVATFEVAGAAGEAPKERLTSQAADTAGRLAGDGDRAGGADRSGGLRLVRGTADAPEHGTAAPAPRPPTPEPRVMCTPRCWCSAPAPVATPRRSGPRTWARRS